MWERSVSDCTYSKDFDVWLHKLLIGEISVVDIREDWPTANLSDELSKLIDFVARCLHPWLEIRICVGAGNLVDTLATSRDELSIIYAITPLIIVLSFVSLFI